MSYDCNETISVTALNGWLNIFHNTDDGTPWTEQCPALLLQEGGFYDDRRMTRVVYASVGDTPGELEPAYEIGNYITTVHETHWPEWKARWCDEDGRLLPRVLDPANR